MKIKIKIPNDNVLTAMGVVGVFVLFTSIYWLGRRAELQQIIDIGKGLDGDDFRLLKVFERDGSPASLFIKTTKD